MELARLVADSILAAAADAVVATDREGVIRIWSPGAERIFGHRLEEALGRSLDLNIPERLRPAHWEGWRRVMETGESRYAHGISCPCPASARMASAGRQGRPPAARQRKG
jgi:PAS domain-containing protein